MDAHEKLVELLKQEHDDSGMTGPEWDEHMRGIARRATEMEN